MYKITTPSGREVEPPRGSHWRMTESEFWRLVEDGRISFGSDGNNIPALKLYLNEVQAGLVPRTWWPHGEVGHTQEAKREIQALFKGTIPFDTPKPERLIERVIHISTNPGDIVLDSFLGSATTAAVAHKMGRRWIGVELGEHCETHCLPRLKSVVNGEDTGGITNEVNWQGGGGFRYYELGPSLISEDEWGNAVINPEFNPAMLAEAMCKLEGFKYSPSDETYWIHGSSSETDYIYVCTQFMSREMLTRISDEVGPERSLLVCCTAFKCNPAEFPNLTIKKIPKAVLKKCEWGHDDYSLEVNNLPAAPPEPEPDEVEEPQDEKPSDKGEKKQGSLLGLAKGGKK